MAKKKDSGLVQDALIPDEMSPLGLLDFNSSCAKIKQAAVDFRRAVNHKMQLETKDAYLDKFHQIDPYTEAVYDTDVLAQHIIDCAEVINRLLTYPKDARRAVLYDNLHDSPQCEELPLSAIGLWALAGSYVGRQLRHGDYDGAITMQRVRKLGGSPKLARQLVDAGLWRETEPDVFEIVAANPDGTMLCKYAATKELQEKRARAGRAGGKASGRSRRSKNEANASSNSEANAKQMLQPDEAKGEALAEAKGEANAKQTGKQKRSTLTYTYSHTDITSPNPSAPTPTPTPVSESEPERTTMAELEARMLEDPFETAWNAYPRHTGSKTEAEKAWNLAIQGVYGRPPADPRQLIASAIAYAKTIDEPKYAPNMSRWLRQGAYMDTMPSRPKPYRHALPDGTVIDDRWITGHIRDHVPAGTFTDAMRTDFWASVKTGSNPEQKAKEIINECQRKAQR